MPVARHHALAKLCSRARLLLPSHAAHQTHTTEPHLAVLVTHDERSDMRDRLHAPLSGIGLGGVKLLC